MNRGMVFVLSVALAGCTTTVKSSSPNHVTVESYQMNHSKAQKLADIECAKYYRHARLTLEPTLEDTHRGRDARSFIFACID
jgi:hypothetical protein